MKHFPTVAALVLFVTANQASAGSWQPPFPLGEASGWVTSVDYPIQALLEKREGVVSFRLDIDTAGRAAQCTITVSSGSSALDSATCNLLTRRARFKPATDSNGKTVPGTWSSAVRWQLPKGLPLPKTAEIITTYLIGSDGSVSECVVERASGDSAAYGAHWPTVCRNMRYNEGYRDAAGKAVARRVRITHTVEILDP